ncbi:DMT family transporter [Rickettsiales endosymbiont of Stachyamoeba lipophora]|uniref:DMT family transporter n=1 Tax=Rickettsiales endosymbiont of Stachyamoeba lipophora TaxID=2486578 RepID=UPI000F6496D9|nr:DMT family transporter [Rickettsiales endosymbiont of Stachyamoeba lipophora]AZL15347.1 DMT family transporter [Rickettsiales endosymbiont of Stachyamoeba lipophora]
MVNCNYILAISYFILSLIIGVANDVIMKYVGQDINVYQIVFLRFFFAILSLIPVIIITGVGTLKTNAKFIHVVRGSLLFAGIAIWCYALNYVHISLATVINFTIPIFVLILAKFILKEKIGVSRWAATMIGFIGVLIVVKGPSEFDSTAAMLLLASLMFALLDVINKKYVVQESIMSMMIYSNIVVSLLSAPLAFSNWISLSVIQLILLGLLGVGANLVLYFLIQAFKHADASALVPYRYFELLISGAMGYMFFSEVPNLNTIFGALLIIPSTLFMSYMAARSKS